MCSRSLLVTAALLCVPLLLPPPPAAGQVTIHETAVIDPGRRAPGADPGGSLESLISPCNPPYDDPGPPVITRRAVFPGERLSLAALTCPGCPAHHMAGELTQGTGYVRLELTRPPGLGGEINGTSFHFREAWGYDVVAVFDQGIPEDSVVIGFTMTYVDFPPPNIEYIEVYLVRRQFQTATRLEPVMIEQGGSAAVSAWVLDQCGGAFPLAATYTATILSGGGRGSLQNPVTLEKGQVLSDLPAPEGYMPTVVFLADGQDADSTTSVEILITPSAAGVEPARVVVPVKPGPTCPVVLLDPANPAPGDTCRIRMMKKRFDGTITEYGPDQLFSVMLYPDEAGTLYSPYRPDTADYFDVVRQDSLMWLTAGEIVEESVSVYLWASEVAPQSRPEKPKLAGGPSLGPDGEMCNAAWATLGQPIRLHILDPLDALQIRFISDTPSMPIITCKARLLGFAGGSVPFEWRITAGWTNDREIPPRSFRSIATGLTSALNSDPTVWVVDWESKIRGGEVDSLQLVSRLNGREYTITRANPYRILGANPTTQIVKMGLSLEEQVVVFMESFPKWRHFRDDGLPIFGPPHGYGLMQLDNPRATDEQVWNWRANRAGGVALLNEKHREALAFPQRMRAKARSGDLPPAFQNATDFESEEQRLKETYQRYNGGTYWQWVPLRPVDPQSPGAWRPRSGSSGYGNRAWVVYSSVQQGTPPPSWN
jgi:hypothetical protein